MLQITSSFPVGAFPDQAHTEPDYCWAPCDWWASQPETRRNFYFCFAFSNRDWRTNINKHKYFQKAAFSGLFPLIQRAASYYPVTEQTRTPTAICSEQLPATAMQHMLKTTAELEDISTEPRAAAPASWWLWQPSRTPWPHSLPSSPSPQPLFIPPVPAGRHSGHPASSEPRVRKQFLCLHPQNQANLKHAHLWNYQGAKRGAVWVIEERLPNPGMKIIVFKSIA